MKRTIHILKGVSKAVHPLILGQLVFLHMKNTVLYPEENSKVQLANSPPSRIRHNMSVKLKSVTSNDFSILFRSIYFVESDGPFECIKIIYFSGHVERMTSN